MSASKTVKSLDKDSINYYDQHPYNEFWIGREYEHRSEVMAIRRLLKNKHFKVALDYGGGYGRLASVLADNADEVILADPSSTLLDYAKSHPTISNLATLHLKKNGVIPVDDSSVDLVTMIRVLHHIEKPEANFKEVYRILKPGGQAIIEVANSAHFINRLKYLAHLKSVPKQPIPIGKSANGLKEDTPFVNHHAKTIEAKLNQNGLMVKDKLSVSNLRSSFLKKHINLDSLLVAESSLQRPLASVYFGPSIFFLVKKR